MSDHLQIDYWLSRAVAALRADQTLQDRGYQIVEIGDLAYGYVPERILEKLPVLLVSCTGEITVEDMDLHGEAERYVYQLRVLAVHTFAEAARVLALKSVVLGELAGAMRAVQYDGTRFEAPTSLHQFFHITPEAFEINPDEEAIFDADAGYQNTYAVAARYRLTVSSRIER